MKKLTRYMDEKGLSIEEVELEFFCSKLRICFFVRDLPVWMSRQIGFPDTEDQSTDAYLKRLRVEPYSRFLTGIVYLDGKITMRCLREGRVSLEEAEPVQVTNMTEIIRSKTGNKITEISDDVIFYNVRDFVVEILREGYRGEKHDKWVVEEVADLFVASEFFKTLEIPMNQLKTTKLIEPIARERDKQLYEKTGTGDWSISKDFKELVLNALTGSDDERVKQLKIGLVSAINKKHLTRLSDNKNSKPSDFDAIIANVKRQTISFSDGVNQYFPDEYKAEVSEMMTNRYLLRHHGKKMLSVPVPQSITVEDMFVVEEDLNTFSKTSFLSEDSSINESELESNSAIPPEELEQKIEIMTYIHRQFWEGISSGDRKNYPNSEEVVNDLVVKFKMSATKAARYDQIVRDGRQKSK